LEPSRVRLSELPGKQISDENENEKVKELTFLMEKKCYFSEVED
jgi:hypothetical protein